MESCLHTRKLMRNVFYIGLNRFQSIRCITYQEALVDIRKDRLKRERYEEGVRQAQIEDERINDKITGRYSKKTLSNSTSSENNDVHNNKETKKKTQMPIESPPEEPKPEECCGNGCSNCVWVEYWDKLEKYKMKNKKQAKSV